MASRGRDDTKYRAGKGSITINNVTLPVLNLEDIKDKCYGYVYITENNITKRKYLGMHYTWKSNYVGSGKYLLADLKKYKKEDFTKYIIDTADSYEELNELEAYYITEGFNMDVAYSEDWYNITSGLQRGGYSWAGLTEEDRLKRSKKISDRNKGRKVPPEQIEQRRQRQLEFMSDPKARERISEATKKAMQDPAIRKKISESKKGKTPSISEERREQMRKNGKEQASKYLNKGDPWNKGISMNEETRDKISMDTRSHYKVILKDEVLFNDLNVRGSYQGIADKITETLNTKIGKHAVADLIKSGEIYKGKKEGLQGLYIERIK